MRPDESAHPPASGRLPPRLTDSIAPVPATLFEEPLEFIFADHFRQRQICSALREIGACGALARADARVLLAYLAHDLPLHHADEECDLFPALRRRAQPEDALGDALDRLSADHMTTAPMIRQIVDALSAGAGDAPAVFDPSIGQIMQTYAACEHRHLAIENGIVLAIARARLTRADLRAMSQSMKARRGLL